MPYDRVSVSIGKEIDIYLKLRRTHPYLSKPYPEKMQFDDPSPAYKKILEIHLLFPEHFRSLYTGLEEDFQCNCISETRFRQRTIEFYYCRYDLEQYFH